MKGNSEATTLMDMGNIHGQTTNIIKDIGRTIKSKLDCKFRNGKGKYVWPDGKVYDGDFVNDQKHG